MSPRRTAIAIVLTCAACSARSDDAVLPDASRDAALHDAAPPDLPRDFGTIDASVPTIAASRLDRRRLLLPLDDN